MAFMLSDYPLGRSDNVLVPEYLKAAKALKEESSPIRLAKVYDTVEKSLSERFEIRNIYPTLKFFVYGKLVDGWAGGQTSTWIMNWLKKAMTEK